MTEQEKKASPSEPLPGLITEAYQDLDYAIGEIRRNGVEVEVVKDSIVLSDQYGNRGYYVP